MIVLKQPDLCAASSINEDRKGQGLRDFFSFEISAWVRIVGRTEVNFWERVAFCKVGHCQSHLGKL